MSDAPPLFPAWSDGLLDELQQEIVTRHIDRFTRRALALTCQAYHRRWYVQPNAQDLRTVVLDLAMLAPLSYIQGYLRWICKKFTEQNTWYEIKTEPSWTVALGDDILLLHAIMIQEKRDDDVHAVIAHEWPWEKPPDFLLDELAAIQSSFLQNRSEKALGRFLAHYQVRPRPLTDEIIVRSRNLRFIRTTVLHTIPIRQIF